MEEQMDEKQSLHIITQMISKAKNNLGNNSFYFLLWGWAVFLTAIAHYILLVGQWKWHFLPWPIGMTVTALISIVYSYREGKNKKAKSYLDKFLETLWICTTVCIVLVLAIITKIADFRASYAALMILYGLGTVITGSIIQFRPLVIGGVIIWCCAASLIWLNFPDALLALAVSVLAGYIIPGYLLRAKRERKLQTA